MFNFYFIFPLLSYVESCSICYKILLRDRVNSDPFVYMNIKIIESRFRNFFKLDEWMGISAIILTSVNLIMFSSRGKPAVNFA